MKLLMTADEIARNPAKWQWWRRQGVTASEAASVMGLTDPVEEIDRAYSSPLALYVEKLHGPGGDPDDDARAFGRFVEPYVAGKFAGQHPELAVGPGGLYCHDGRPWQMATFDRLAYSAECGCGAGDRGRPGDIVCTCLPELAGPVECKHSVSADGWGQPGSDVMPLPYRIQGLQQMDVAGASQVFVPCLFLPSRKVRTYVIRRDEQAERDMAIMRREAEAFLDRLARGDPPPPDWKPATRNALIRAYPGVEDREVVIPVKLAARWAAARRAQKSAKRRKDRAENEIRARAGNARTIVAWDPAAGEDRVVATRSISPRDGYTVEPGTQDRLNAGKWGT